MKLIAQNIPGLQDIFNCNPVNPKGCSSPIPRVGGQNFANLADFISGLLNVVFYIAVFLAFYWLVWGAWAYLFSSGEKENLAKARARIRWALIGLIVIFLAYLIARYVAEVFAPSKQGIPF